MKILYILPDETVKSGGNWVTATRLAEGLKKRGIIVNLVEVKDITEERLEKYDAIHAFHVFKTLIKINSLLMKMDKTVIVSFTGTDLKQLEEERENKEEIIHILNRIDGITVFHSEAKEELIKEGILSKKIKVIPQTSMPIEVQYSEKIELVEDLLHQNCITFLFAAGIRKVKGPLEMIDMMTSLVEKIKNIRLILIGPILEKDLGEKVKKEIKNKEWVKYMGEVSHQETQYFISKSDIVINTSHSEGMSNTLLEAQQLGKTILATDNSGNRSIVNHGVDGYLFNDGKEFEHYATKLVQDVNLRRKMGLAGLESRKTYDWKQEVTMYEKVYKL